MKKLDPKGDIWKLILKIKGNNEQTKQNSENKTQSKKKIKRVKNIFGRKWRSNTYRMEVTGE